MGVSPDTRALICFAEDEKLVYVVQGCCEVDDVLHCLLGMLTKMLAEIAIVF